MSLAIFLKPIEKWRKNYRKLIKFSSQKASQRKGNRKENLFKKNGTIDASRRKYSGDINQEYSGLKKGREILGPFTSLP